MHAKCEPTRVLVQKPDQYDVLGNEKISIPKGRAGRYLVGAALCALQPTVLSTRYVTHGELNQIHSNERTTGQTVLRCYPADWLPG